MIWTYMPAAIRDRAFFALKLIVVLYMNLLIAMLVGSVGEYLTNWPSILWGGLPFIALCALTLNSRGARERLRV